MLKRIDRLLLSRGLRLPRVHVTPEEEELLRSEASYPNVNLMPQWQQDAIKAASFIVYGKEGKHPGTRIDFDSLESYYDYWVHRRPTRTRALHVSLRSRRSVVGLFARGVFWLSLLWILGDSAFSSWRDGNVGMIVAKLVFFPVTYVVWPWLSGLWWLFVVSIVAYAVSTFVGGLEPVD